MKIITEIFKLTLLLHEINIKGAISDVYTIILHTRQTKKNSRIEIRTRVNDNSYWYIFCTFCGSRALADTTTKETLASGWFRNIPKIALNLVRSGRSRIRIRIIAKYKLEQCAPYLFQIRSQVNWSKIINHMHYTPRNDVATSSGKFRAELQSSHGWLVPSGWLNLQIIPHTQSTTWNQCYWIAVCCNY